MTENEKLRALLAEALDQHAHCLPCVPDCVWTRIDAALAEPVEPSESEYAMHARIRADYDKTVADCWRAKVAEVERERDEARAEVERLKVDVEALHAGIAAQDEVLTRRYNEQLSRANTAYQRGAEAMREAAAQEADKTSPPKSIGRDHGRHHIAGAQQAAARIRALPIPEDKR